MKKFLTTKQLTELIGGSPRTPEHWRLIGEGPRFIRLGKRRVVYDYDDVMAWLDSNRRKSTSDPGQAVNR